MLSEWPSTVFLEELKASAYALALKIIAKPNEALGITESSLHGFPLDTLVVMFSQLSVVLESQGRRTHYFRVKFDIWPPDTDAPILPLFWYEVEFSPEGEVWDDFFDHY